MGVKCPTWYRKWPWIWRRYPCPGILVWSLDLKRRYPHMKEMQECTNCMYITMTSEIFEWGQSGNGG